MKSLLLSVSCLASLLLASCGTTSTPWYEAEACGLALADGSPSAFVRTFGSPDKTAKRGGDTLMQWSYSKDRTVIRQTPIRVSSHTTLHNTSNAFMPDSQPIALTTTSVRGGEIYSTDVTDSYTLLVTVRGGKTKNYQYVQSGHGAIPIRDESVYRFIELIHACSNGSVDDVKRLWEENRARGFATHRNAVWCAIMAAGCDRKDNVLYFIREHGVSPDEKARGSYLDENDRINSLDSVKGSTGKIFAHAVVWSVREVAKECDAESVLAILP